jgi:hypothetical protein
MFRVFPGSISTVMLLELNLGNNSDVYVSTFSVTVFVVTTELT